MFIIITTASNSLLPTAHLISLVTSASSRICQNISISSRDIRPFKSAYQRQVLYRIMILKQDFTHRLADNCYYLHFNLFMQQNYIIFVNYVSKIGLLIIYLIEHPLILFLIIRVTTT